MFYIASHKHQCSHYSSSSRAEMAFLARNRQSDLPAEKPGKLTCTTGKLSPAQRKAMAGASKRDAMRAGTYRCGKSSDHMCTPLDSLRGQREGKGKGQQATSQSTHESVTDSHDQSSQWLSLVSVASDDSRLRDDPLITNSCCRPLHTRYAARAPHTTHDFDNTGSRRSNHRYPCVLPTRHTPHTQTLRRGASLHTDHSVGG